MTLDERLIHLAGGAVSCVIDVSTGGPRVLHWGARLAREELDALAATTEPAVVFSSFDVPRALGLLPVSGEGWSSTPGIEWHRAGAYADPRLAITSVERGARKDHGACDAVDISLADAEAEVTVLLTLRLDVHGILRARYCVTSHSDGERPLDLAALRIIMPLPARANEIMDFTGRWTRERAPQRMPVSDGSHRRAARRGRPGHDAPYLTVVGEEGFQFRSREVWAVHVAWSGDSEVSVERLPEGAGVHSAVVAAGELLAPGEIRLGPGDQYCSPDVLLAWSNAGLDGLSEAFHGYARGLDAHPNSPRPLTLNTWEAVYFDHDPGTLTRLAALAAQVGVERFVLDDGWFAGRPDDRSGLGDWVVDTSKWPDGVQQLADAVHGHGMGFGLWFEPEMVNPGSELARAHADWVLGTRIGPTTWRHQLVLDLTRREVREHLLERIDHAVRTLGLDYIKWDHNRDLHGAVAHVDGAHAVHRQTLAAYELIDTLHQRHPALEIESCASGGARVDLGILSRTQRVWPSDTNDPIERQMIQRWTGLLLPPEVVGSHVGPARAHTTHRTSSLDFRFVTALFGHAGIEWDLASCSDEELVAIARWARLYKEFRPLLHSGRTVRADVADPGALLHGVVSIELDHALFSWARVATSGAASTPRVRVPGLDPFRQYAISLREDLGKASRQAVSDPSWAVASPPLRASGRFLAEVGLPLPLLNPGAALLLEFRS